MTRGTTPTISLSLNTDMQMSEMKQIWVTLKNLMFERTYQKEEIQVLENNSLIIQPTQEETLKFCKGDVDVQVRLLTHSEKAYASNIKTISVKDILKEGVIK